MLKYYQSNVALGSTAGLTLVSAAGKETVDEWFRQLWLTIFQFEQRFSRFLPDSELSRFNRTAGVTQPVSGGFHDLLVASRHMSELTDGLYNPFILPALQTAGYVQSMVSAHSDDPVDDYSKRSVVAYDRLRIDKDRASIPYGTALDLGGIGKGYLADKLGELAAGFPELTGFWFSLGGDVVAGGLDEHDVPWQIQIEDTSAPAGGAAGSVQIKAATRHAVATSSTLRRTGTKNGKKWHHIIDPRTSRPTESDVETASISAGSPLLADILASCAIILGSRKAASFCRDRGASGVLLQTRDRGNVYWGDVDKP